MRVQYAKLSNMTHSFHCFQKIKLLYIILYRSACNPLLYGPYASLPPSCCSLCRSSGLHPSVRVSTVQSIISCLRSCPIANGPVLHCFQRSNFYILNIAVHVTHYCMAHTPAFHYDTAAFAGALAYTLSVICAGQYSTVHYQLCEVLPYR